MAIFKYSCINCKLGFTASDALPALNEQQCPRCGWGCFKWVITPRDKAVGTHYFGLSVNEVWRAGRELKTLLLKYGLVDSDVKNGELDNISAYTPTF